MGEDIKRDFTNREIEIMISILNINNKKLMSLSGLAREIGIRPSNPYYAKISKYLTDNNMIEIERLGRNKVIKINHSKISDLIDEQEICVFWFEYFKKHHIVSW